MTPEKILAPRPHVAFEANIGGGFQEQETRSFTDISEGQKNRLKRRTVIYLQPRSPPNIATKLLRGSSIDQVTKTVMGGYRQVRPV